MAGKKIIQSEKLVDVARELTMLCIRQKAT